MYTTIFDKHSIPIPTEQERDRLFSFIRKYEHVTASSICDVGKDCYIITGIPYNSNDSNNTYNFHDTATKKNKRYYISRSLHY